MTAANAFRLSEAERRTYRRFADLALPRHTSYPISPVWSSKYGPAELRSDLQSVRDRRAALSLYVHIPFCERLCYYCACTKEIVPANKRREHDPVDELLAGLEIEAHRLAELLSANEVHQFHLGGGSPTFLHCDQLARLWKIFAAHFAFADSAEIAIEIDPRTVSQEHLQLLRQLGFNRISLGIQDFAAEVQMAVNRLQPFELVEQTVRWCRELGFPSINFDLIYGLPFQTLDTMADTLEKTLRLAPDRVAFYRLAVIPEMFRWQKTFTNHDLPGGDLSLDLNLLAINRFMQAGYEFIGLDHFARPAEGLMEARAAGTLRRNFQGMTTAKPLEIVGLGPSAISQLDCAFAQNAKTSQEWRDAIDRDFATIRGLHLSDDDRLRRELMQQLYGYGEIDKKSLQAEFGISFDDYFSREIAHLHELESDGIVVHDTDVIRVTPVLGRLLVRVVAAVFDRYLPEGSYREGLPEQLASRVG